MPALPSNSLAFHPASFGDFNGRVFSFDGGLYRGVAAARAALYRKLFEDGIVANLVSKKLLVPTEVSPLAVEGYDLVLKHQVVPVVSYAYEWTMRMLQLAALVVLDLELELTPLGLTLQDAHPWNVLFHGPNPLWVDFGSIVPAKSNVLWRAYDEFCNFYLHPLLVMSEGHHRVARRLLTDSDDGILQAEAIALTGHGRPRSTIENLGQAALNVGRRVVPTGIRGILRGRRAADRDVSSERPAFLRELRDKIAGITPRPPRHTTVHVNGASSQADMEPARVAAVERALAEVRAASAFEVAYESPFYSTLGARAGARTVAVGVDETHVESLFEHARRERLDVLPLVMDIRTPSPALGVCGQTSAPATDRLRGDLVIALDVTHHLCVRYRLNFDQVAAALATFANRAVLVDFVEGTHPSTRAYLTDDFGWYAADRLESALRRQFATVQKLDTPRPTFLCHKGARNG